MSEKETSKIVVKVEGLLEVGQIVNVNNERYKVVGAGTGGQVEHVSLRPLDDFGDVRYDRGVILIPSHECNKTTGKRQLVALKISDKPELYVKIRPQGESIWMTIKPDLVMETVQDDTDIWEIQTIMLTEKEVKELPEFTGW